MPDICQRFILGEKEFESIKAILIQLIKFEKTLIKVCVNYVEHHATEPVFRFNYIKTLQLYYQNNAFTKENPKKNLGL